MFVNMTNNESSESPGTYVKLNVGGFLFNTTLGTLTKHDTMLRAMFSGRMAVPADSEGWVMIDRCGKHFDIILNYLRDNSVALPESVKSLQDLLAEANYYCIAELVSMCEKAIAAKTSEPFCRAPLITSHRDERMIISQSLKPVVMLKINRHNNPYPYFDPPAQSLLNNYELFDELAVRFNGRILFIKDVLEDTDVCSWSFFARGKLLKKLNCIDNVKCTGNIPMQTDVLFMKMRIYEETLNMLLHEDAPVPASMHESCMVGGLIGIVGTLCLLYFCSK